MPQNPEANFVSVKDGLKVCRLHPVSTKKDEELKNPNDHLWRLTHSGNTQNITKKEAQSLAQETLKSIKSKNSQTGILEDNNNKMI